MTCESGDSSGSVGFEERNKIVGLPKLCWCGEKLQGDKHLFKWLDDAILSEIEVMNLKMAMLDDMVKEITKEKKEIEKLFERFEEFVLRKVDNLMEESKKKFKSAMIASFGGLFLIGFVSVLLFLK